MLYPSAVETQLDSKPQFLSLPSLRITKLSQGNDAILAGCTRLGKSWLLRLKLVLD